MTRYLIVNADDMGYLDGTVAAISELFESGVVTSTSVMVNQPDWPQAAAVLRAHPEWGAGVHLVMNDGHSVLPTKTVPTLVDRRGFFRDGRALLMRYPFISHSQLQAEWKAQIEKFIADTGRMPSHLDLHCHYPYVFSSWFRLSVELAREYGHIAVRSPFDDALEEKAPALAENYGGFPPWFVVWMGRRYRTMVDRLGLPRSNFWAASFSQDGHRTVEELLNILEQLPVGITELLCHPGTEGWRAEDYRALMDPRVRQRIAALGIVLVNYQDVKDGIGRDG